MSQRYEMPVAIRPSDINGGGHVDHVQYLEYFAVVRFDFLRKLGLIGQPTPGKRLAFVVASASLDFKAELFLNDQVTGALWIDKVGNTSFDIAYELRKPEGLVAIGLTSMVHFDYVIRKSVPLSDEIRQKLAPFMTAVST